MLSKFFRRKLHYMQNGYRMHADAGGNESSYQDGQNRIIDKSIEKNLQGLKATFHDDCDLKIHSFSFGPQNCYEGRLVFFDGMSDSRTITEAILEPMLSWMPDAEDASTKPDAQKDVVEILAQEVLCSGDIKRVQTLPELAAGCLSGDTALLVDGSDTALIISAKGWDKRGVTEPQSESVVRGPREGFTENLRTNTALIRRKIQSRNLRAELMTVGRKTKTVICILYLEDVADPNVIKQVRLRIGALDVDSVLESGYIEEYIEDAPFSPFPTIAYSEKPDVVAGKVLEGRVAIIVDGTPFVLTVPMLFVESFQSAEDYYMRAPYASFLRVLRYIAYFIAVFAPAIYIALTSYHQELIPTTLLLTIANVREGTPFPVFMEMLIMVFAFEILREGGIRLPRPVGQAISIVGALVMGDAAVSAGLVGAPVVITIAITAVAGFMVPMQNDSASLLRLFMMILASFAGLYGTSMGFLALLIHLATLSSFGVPYFDGFAWTRNMQDTIIRMPMWSMVKRPKWIAKGDITRRKFFIPPLRPFAEENQESGEGGNP